MSKADIWHSAECRCRIIDGAIYVAAPCIRFGNHLTKKRMAQLVHKLERLQGKPKKTKKK